MNEESNNAPSADSAPSKATPSEWEELTPAQVQELERVRSERIAAETRLEELKQQNAVAQKERDELRQQQAVRDAFRESGVRFHKQSDALTLLGQIDFDTDGTASIDGVPLVEAIRQVALQNPNLADGRTLRALKEQRESKMPKSKADFQSVADKVAFINAHGAEAYEKLPLRPPVVLGAGAPKTWDEYRSMSISDRAAVAGRYGGEFIAELYKKRARA